MNHCVLKQINHRCSICSLELLCLSHLVHWRNSWLFRWRFTVFVFPFSLMPAGAHSDCGTSSDVCLCVFCSQVKWHEICLSIPAAILEVLNAWENGVLSVEAVQVCATPSSWNTSHSKSVKSSLPVVQPPALLNPFSFDSYVKWAWCVWKMMQSGVSTNCISGDVASSRFLSYLPRPFLSNPGFSLTLKWKDVLWVRTPPTCC